MTKILLSLIFISSLAFSAGLKATGCDLSQFGDVELTLGSKNYEKATYKAITPSGKNFKTIFVGSTITVDGTVATITDIKANKREKGKPRTGVVTLDVNSEIVVLTYHYNKGNFSAIGILKDGRAISFALEIKALLCHAK